MADASSSRYTHDLPDQLQLQVGQIVRLPLISASGGGYRWQVDDAMPVARVAIELEPSASAAGTPGGQPPPSGSRIEMLVVEGMSAGTASVSLQLVRSWEHDAMLAQQRITLVVC